MKLGKVFCSLMYFLLCMEGTRQLAAQEFIAPGYTQYTQYTSKDGLASSEIHCIYQDRDGFIWIGTDQGLCHFDSEKWTVFTSIDGLPDNMVTQIQEDEKGDLWLQGLNGTIFRLDRMTHDIFVPAFNEALDNMFPKSRLHEWHINAEGTGYLSIYEVGTYQNWTSGAQDVRHNHFLRIENFQIEEHLSFGAYDYQFFRYSTGGNELWAYNRAHEPSSSTFSKELSNEVVGFGSELILPGFSSGISLSGSLQFFQPDEYRMLLAINNWLIEFDLEANKILSKTKHPADIIEVFKDKKGNLYLGYKNQMGFKYYENAHLGDSGEAFLMGTTVTSFFEDGDSALWVGTSESGLLRFSRSPFLPVKAPEESLPITRLHTVGGRTFVIGNNTNGYEVVYEKGKPSLKLIAREQKLLRDISDIWCRNDSCILSYFSKPTVVSVDSQGQHLLKPIAKTRPKAMVPMGKGKTLGYSSGLGYSIHDLHSLTDIYVSSRDYTFFRANCALELSNGSMVIGSDAGIKLVGDSTATNIFSEALSNYFIYDLKEDHNGYLWAATKGNGLCRIHIETGSFTVVSTEQGLPLNSIYDLEIAEGVIFGATNGGLFAIKNAEKEPGNERVEVWTQANGLPSSDLQELAHTSQHLLINSAGQLVAIKLKELIKPKTGDKIFLRNVTVNEGKRTVDELNQLSADENNIRIKYQAFHYGQKKFSSWYKIKASDKWTKTNNTELNLIDLNPGSYDIMVSPIPEDIPGKTMKLSFEIAPPFTKTLGFLILVVAGSLVLFSLAFWIILSRERLSRKLVVSQQQALTSQMNPHFIFNALNSVQYFIGEGSKKLAQSYLGEFAVLMRQVLDSSRSGQISLEQEIASLKTYMELERLRFEEHYDFSIDIDAKTEEMVDGIVLPSMVVQPYVENAILHGLRPMEGGGHLLLQFGIVDDLLKIVIKDNGVGRKAASERKESKEHTSHGMNITTERIDLLNKRLKQKISITVFDLEPAGTEVILLLPFESIF